MALQCFLVSPMPLKMCAVGVDSPAHLSLGDDKPGD